MHIIREDTAYFYAEGEESTLPCVDTTKKKANMLTEMKIASSGASGYKGGTYGTDVRIDRFGNPKSHSGIDFAAEPGTPFYAQYDGKVVKVVTSIVEGEKGEAMGALGNRIEIESTIDGKKVRLFYCHLQYGKTLAQCPGKGRAYRVGDIVHVGDLLGYSGATGNAWNVPNKHIHFMAKEDETIVDPIKYINGSLSNDYSIIENIKCDDLQSIYDFLTFQYY